MGGGERNWLSERNWLDHLDPDLNPLFEAKKSKAVGKSSKGKGKGRDAGKGKGKGKASGKGKAGQRKVVKKKRMIEEGQKDTDVVFAHVVPAKSHTNYITYCKPFSLTSGTCSMLE